MAKIIVFKIGIILIMMWWLNDANYQGRQEFLHFVPAFKPPYKVFSTKGVSVLWWEIHHLHHHHVINDHYQIFINDQYQIVLNDDAKKQVKPHTWRAGASLPRGFAFPVSQIMMMRVMVVRMMLVIKMMMMRMTMQWLWWYNDTNCIMTASKTKIHDFNDNMSTGYFYYSLS